MKRSPFWLVPILIASCLLAIIVRKSAALPSSAEHGERAANRHKDHTGEEHRTAPQSPPSIPIIKKEMPAPETKPIASVIQKQSYKHWWNSENAPEWALFFLTVPYVAVSIGLFLVTWKSVNASLIANRPYLLPIRVHMEVLGKKLKPGEPLMERGFTTVKRIVPQFAKIKFNNFGTGPAIIKVAIGHVRFQRTVHDFPKPHTFAECTKLRMDGSSVVPSNRGVEWSYEFSDYAKWSKQEHMEETERFAREIEDLNFLFYGCVYYEDVFGKNYSTEFCFMLDPVGVSESQFMDDDGAETTLVKTGVFVNVGPAENNQRT